MMDAGRDVLIIIMTVAVVRDFRDRKIPNWLTASGMLCGIVYQTAMKGGIGFVLSLGGILLPVLFVGGLFYFRMIGAGDIKLLCTVGSFLGIQGCIVCMTGAFLIGGMIAAGKMIYCHRFWKRINYFIKYITEYSEDRVWKSYISGAEDVDKFCFSLPVCLSVLGYFFIF